MIKTSVNELCIGMHVTRPDYGLLKTSFFQHFFLVSNQKQLKSIAARLQVHLDYLDTFIDAFKTTFIHKDFIRNFLKAIAVQVYGRSSEKMMLLRDENY
jgi:hypothetical protein